MSGAAATGWRTCTTAQLLARSGVTHKQLDYWRRTDVLPPPVGGRARPGSGHPCHWSEGHVLAATALRMFCEADAVGAPSGRRQRIALVAAVYQHHLEGLPFADRWLVVDVDGARIEHLDELLVRTKVNACSVLRLDELAEVSQ